MKKLTNEIVDQRLLENNSSIKRIDNYKNHRIKIRWQCLKCNNIWLAKTYYVLSHSNACPTCSGLMNLSNEIVDERLKLQNRKIERIGNYVNNHTKIEWKCLTENCNNIWNAVPISVLHNKTGCPRCGKTGKLSNEIVDRRLIETTRNIERIGDYINNRIKINWKCLECNNIWKTSSGNILDNKTGCPRCNSSKGELEVERVLKKILLNSDRYYKVQVRFNNCKNPKTNRKLSFDFVVYNEDGSIYCIIEYDGKHHFIEEHIRKNNSRYNLNKFEQQKFRDLIKDKYCIDNNIKLIRIPYWNRDKIEEILIGEI